MNYYALYLFNLIIKVIIYNNIKFNVKNKIRKRFIINFDIIITIKFINVKAFKFIVFRLLKYIFNKYYYLINY